MTTRNAPFEDLGGGVTLIDTGFGREQLAAAYLVEQDGRAAFVDCGTNFSVPTLLDALAWTGREVGDVDWLILTHIHLDHAGGAGALMARLPNARLVVHPQGARHMADPARIMAGVKSVYGEEVVRRDYGELVPVEPSRIVATEPGSSVRLGTRELTFLHTPGHARHHHCIWDPETRGVFAGDTLGVAYRELAGGHVRHCLPSTSPVQFEPDALHESIGRLMELAPEVAYLTHFGPVHQLEDHVALLLPQIDAMVRLALATHGQEDAPARLRDGLGELYLHAIAACGCAVPAASVAELLAGDIELNALGLEHWVAQKAP
jgi:glyoxylase-like metal-dependent hydrolase (beta-lactamase superfamily II)